VRAQAPAGPDVTERVRAVVGAVAPLLGLDPERVPITVRGGAGRPHGAARHDGLVFTGRFDPAMPPGRSLIVHELAHLCQHRNGVSAKGARAPDVTAAEAEAGGLAAAVREGRPLWVPRQVLPGGHTARDTGASGIAVDSATPTAATLERDLEALAAQNHLDSVRVIADQLDPRQGAHSKSTGENSLRALSALQFVVARALVRSLRAPIRLRLACFQDEHHARYPEVCVAVLSALTADELRLLPAPADRAGDNGAAAALHGVDPGRLSTTARRALLDTLRRLPVQAHDELERGDRGALFSRLLRTPPDPGTDAAELAAALRGEEELAERRAGGRATPARAPETRPTGVRPEPAPAKPQPVVPGPGQPATGPEAGPEPEGAPGALPGAAPGVPRRAPRQVELLMPPPPSTPAPEQQQRLTKVKHGADTAAARGKKLPTAPQTVGAARGAVKEPPAETKARAGKKLADTLGAQPIPQLVELGKEIVAAVKERRPPKTEDLTASKANQAAKDAGHTITASVGKETTRVQGSYDRLSPDPAGQPTLTPTEIHRPGTQVADPGIAAPSAAPGPIPAERLSLDADRDAVEAKAAQARMDRHSAEPLQGTPPFSDAAQGRADLAGLAATGAAGVAKQQAEAIDAAQADMADLQDRALEALTAARAGTVSDVHTGQRGLVGHEENTRATISALALKHYNGARAEIEPLLSKLPRTALALWETGLAGLSAEFTQHLARVQGWIDERHSGVGGWFLGKWDHWTGYPDWVPEEYDAAEDAFGEGVRDLLLSIGLEVNSILANVEEVIQAARTKIDNLFRDLPDGLQKWADGERKRFGDQLDALSGQVADVRTTFVRDISQRAVSAVTDVQEKVEALRAEARGVIGRVLDAIEAFLDDPVKAIINGLLNLLNIPPKSFWALVDKIAAVIDQIADDPETFCNNLIAGIRQGFSLFFDHFPAHLLEGFWTWLTSGLGPIGVQLPTDFSPGSLFAFVLQLMGLTWTNIREILVRQIGPKNVELIEKAWQLISMLIEKGTAGIVELLKEKLDPATIIGTIVDAAIDFAVTRLIKSVTIKVLELFNPASAVLEAIELIYRVLKWVFENAARIFTLIETVVDGIADVLAGNVGKLALSVEKALTGLIAPVIDFLAGWLDIEDLPMEIADVIKKLQTVVLGVAEQVIGALAERAKGLLASLGLGEEPKPGGARDEELGTTVRFTAAGETHKLYVETTGSTAHLMVASEPMTVNKRLADFRGRATGAGGQLPFFSNDAERDKALSLIVTAEGKTTEADRDADKIVRQHRKQSAEAGEDAAANQAVAQEERSLAAILFELYKMFGEYPGDDELDMRAAYSGSTGSGEISFRRRRETAKTAYVMGSGPIVGREKGIRRDRVTYEAAALLNILSKQVLVPAPSALMTAVPQLGDAAAKSEQVAKDKLEGKKVQPPPEALQQGLDATAVFASTVAAYRLIGGGEIVERAVSALADDLKSAEPGGVFATVSSIRTYIAEQTAAARLAARSEDPTQARTTTRRFAPGGPAVVIGTKGAVVSALASYQELVVAITSAADQFGPTLARALHDVPVGKINAAMEITLRGQEVTKDQDRFVAEVALLLRVEMARANAAWAFIVPRLLSANSAAEVAQALADDVFPHAIAGFVEQYRNWGPKVFDAASASLLDKLGADFGQKEGMRGGEQVFLDLEGIQAAVGAVKEKLRTVYDEAVSKV